MALSVRELQDLSFALLSDHNKLEIKRQGRPMPLLEMHQPTSTKSKVYKRVFGPEFYSTNDWICGCDKTMSLFCFPCILFGGELAWTKNGVNDLKHLAAKIRKHQLSAKHLRNAIGLAMLGKLERQSPPPIKSPEPMSPIHCAPSPPAMEQASELKVPLKKIVECFKLTGAYEISIGNHEDDLDDPEDPFVKLLHFCTELDSELRAHVELIKALRLLDIAKVSREVHLGIYELCKKRIREEVIRSSFLAIIISENIDANENAAFSMVLRYELEGQVLERFWCFFNPGETGDLSECILKELAWILYGFKERLISQSYDGAASLMGFTLDICRAVQIHYPYAHLVPCYAHSLAQVVEQVVSKNPEIRNFFAEVAQVSEFFSESHHRMEALEVAMANSSGIVSEMRWNIKTANDLFEKKDPLLGCLTILASSHKSSKMTVNGALRTQRLLHDGVFNFWLSFFHQIFTYVDIMDHELQSNVGDLNRITECIQNFEINIEALKTSLQLASFEGANGSEPRIKRSYQEAHASELMATAGGLCDVIVHQIKITHEFQGHVILTKILMPDRHQLTTGVITKEEWDFLGKAYPMLDKDRLKNEIDVLFSRYEFSTVSGPLHLLQNINHLGVGHAFPEVVTAIKIVLTAPNVTEELGRCFPTLQKVNAILKLNRKLSDSDLLASRTMLSLEREMIDEDSGFVDRVVNNFLMINNLKKLRASSEVKDG